MHPPVELQDILTFIPDVILDVRYSGTNNITGKKLYENQMAWLRREPMEKLVIAAEELREQGFVFVIYDAYRPQSVQKKLRAVCSDDNYVEQVSNHCRGITVDLSLAWDDGTYLDMGTDYDDFSDKSKPASDKISPEQAYNREILESVMKSAGFTQHPHEWWHFDFQPEQEWGLIDDETNAYSPA